MTEYQLHGVFNLPEGPVVCGRNFGRDCGVGDVFASLWWVHRERDDRSGKWGGRVWIQFQLHSAEN